MGERAEKIAGRLRLFVVGAAAALGLTLAPAASAAPAATFYTLPPATHAYSVTAGPEGAIWFSGRHGASGLGTGGPVIGRIGGDGQVKAFDLPPDRYVGPLAAGSDGNLWFTEAYSNSKGYTVQRVGRMSPAGEFAEFETGEHVGGVAPIVPGPDGNLWFTFSFRKKGLRKQGVGRISVFGEVRRFHLPRHSYPTDIVAGPDGNLWFTESAPRGPKIGRITPEGQVTHFPLPTRKRVPGEIVAGPDGSLWFSESPTVYYPKVKARVGRIDMAGSITEFRLPENGWVGALAAGPGGRLWYTTRLPLGPLGIGSLTPDGVASGAECVQPGPCETDADALAAGPDGALWFSASKFYSHNGGGGTGIMETISEESEAGLIGRLAG